MDTKPPPSKPVDDRLRTLKPEVVIQRLYHGGMTRLGRLLEARSASAAHEVERQTARHGAEAPATKAARDHAADAAHLARAARIEVQRSDTTPQRAEKNERVLLARLVDGQGDGVACLGTQLLDPSGAVVATATSDRAGVARLSYRGKRVQDVAAAAEQQPRERQPRESFTKISAAAPRDNTGNTFTQGQNPGTDRRRDHILLIQAKGKHGQQRVPVAMSTGQTTMIEVLVDLPDC